MENRRWHEEKGRKAILSASIPVDSFSHGYLKKCFEVYKERAEGLGFTGLSYKGFTTKAHEALSLKYNVEHNIQNPHKPKTIRYVKILSILKFII